MANSPDILFLQDTDGDGKADTARGRRHRLRPRRHARAAQLADLGAGRLALRLERRLQPEPRRATAARPTTSPARSSGSIRGPASSSSSARGRATPGASPGTTKASAFASACVIDHLWHLTETGYYHRQGGPYPPFTWKIESIVEHKHQKAAYCGIHFFDSDAYPRSSTASKLYMGNIHGNCINVDRLERDGSTYVATGRARLPRRQRRLVHARRRRRPARTAASTSSTGTTATTATRTPTATPPASTASRAGSTASATRTRRGAPGSTWRRRRTTQLIERLGSPNVYDRDMAQRLLAERDDARDRRPPLQALVARRRSAREGRGCMPSGRGSAGPISTRISISSSSTDADAGFRAWGVRAAGNLHRVDAGGPRQGRRRWRATRAPTSSSRSRSPRGRSRGSSPSACLTEVASRTAATTRSIPHIVWQNLHPLLDSKTRPRFLAALDRAEDQLRVPAWSRSCRGRSSGCSVRREPRREAGR